MPRVRLLIIQWLARQNGQKDQALNQEKLLQSKAYDAVSGSLGDFKETLIKTASENENLAGVTYGAAVAVGGLALAAGAAALTLRGMGGGKVPDLPTGTRGGLASKATNAAKQQVLLVLLTLALSYLNLLMMLDIRLSATCLQRSVLAQVVIVQTLCSKPLSKVKPNKLQLKKKQSINCRATKAKSIESRND